MFFQSFLSSGLAILEILIVGGIGFFLVRKKLLDDNGLAAFSRLTIDVTLPVLIFCQLIRNFSFSIYPNWWIFPVLSIVVTTLGLIIGEIFIKFIKGHEHKNQFLSMIAFQNSGYLPLALIATLLPKDTQDELFIYLFLFLLGFNLVMWSFGVHILTSQQKKKFDWAGLFNPPVIATLVSLVFVFLGLNKIIPEFVLKPLNALGECTVPLSMLIVGGNLAQIHLRHIDRKAVSLMILAKMIILPAIGIIMVMIFNLPVLLGLLFIIQLIVPPATSISVILRHYKKDDLLVSQGILFTYIAGIITMPVFLSLYFFLAGLK